MKGEKAELAKTVHEIIGLLRECNYTGPADLYESKLKAFESSPPDSKEFQDMVLWFDRSIAGMGSFDDMPLSPKTGSKLSPARVREYQQELENRLFQALKPFRPNSSAS